MRQMLRQQNFVEVAKQALYQLQAMRAEEADHHQRAIDIDIICNNLQYAMKSLAPKADKAKQSTRPPPPGAAAARSTASDAAVRESAASATPKNRSCVDSKLRTSALDTSLDWPAATTAAVADYSLRTPGEHQSGYYVAIPGFPDCRDTEDDPIEQQIAELEGGASTGYGTDGQYTGLIYGAV